MVQIPRSLRFSSAAQDGTNSEEASALQAGPQPTGIGARMRIVLTGLPARVNANLQPAGSAEYDDHQLMQWKRSAPPGEENGRREAVKKILTVVKDMRKKLDLTSLGLTSLPALPPGLAILNARNNRLTILPTLPPGLTSLDACENGLTMLPTLPPGLITLRARDNQLTTLPALPPTLKHLQVDKNRLTALPALPASLRSLDLAENPSLNIPVEVTLPSICERVQQWQQINPDSVSGTRVAAGHSFADAIESSERIPVPFALETGPGASSAATAMELDERRPRHDEVPAETLRIQLRHDGRHGDAIVIVAPPAADPGAPVEPGAGPSAAAVPRTSTRPRDIEGWKRPATKLARGNGPTAERFQEFLHQLRGIPGPVAPPEYDNPLTRPAFVLRVDTLLDAMEQSPELRSICLAIGQNATASCGDRIGLALNDMEIARINDDARLGRYSEIDLFKMGRGLYRLDVLDGIITNVTESQRAVRSDVDPIGIRLAFQTQLASRLDLPGVSHVMLYLCSANLSTEDFDEAAAAVLRNEAESGGIGFLVKWQPWQEAMKRRNPASFRRVEQSIREQQAAFAVLPQGLSSQLQLSLYKDVMARERTELENFTKTETVNFLSENEHLLPT